LVDKFRKFNYQQRVADRSIRSELEEAIASYDRALEFKQDSHEAWYNRGFALVNLGRLEEAIASYREALNIRSQDASSFYNLACVYALQSNVDNSITHLQQAIDLEPDKYIDLARQDKDFSSLQNDPRFIELVRSS
jgi:tetratricopeptide (TPR) repeat protein